MKARARPVPRTAIGGGAVHALITIWLAAPCVAFCIAFSYYVLGTLGPDTLITSVRDLSRVFVPFAGAVLGFVYAERQKNGSPQPHASRRAIVIALLASLAWNVAVLTPVVRSLFDATAPFPDAVQASDEIATYLSWAVAPALGYFFGGAGGHRGPQP